MKQIFPDVDLDDATAEPTRRWTTATASLPPAELKVQKLWDNALIDCAAQSMHSTATDRDKARLLAVETKEAGAWLNALPIPSLGNLLDDVSLRVTVALRLGAVVCLPHRCTCGKEVNENGHHGLSCKFSAGRHSRHSSLNDVLKRALVSASLPAIREPPGLVRQDGKRPDGMSMSHGNKGKRWFGM
ncbi:hypothetical protein BV898_03355 [Hypsibius exemplaris]|uniref:Uncharacterized protein n=1 Tax=Hypsibius exemplaris TaxID=2072580 RepID=A0A1W0X5Z2_HYPEX|nr:hypothetical protein BV898_03355 [Hypsibius exemplaris]